MNDLFAEAKVKRERATAKAQVAPAPKPGRPARVAKRAAAVAVAAPAQPGTAVAAYEPPRSMLEVVMRASTDPTVNPEKMKALLELQERVVAKQAEASFNRAMVEVQTQLQAVTIAKNGKIKIEKNGRVIQETPYAKYEDIHRAIMPMLLRCGLSLTHRTGTAPDGKITVAAVLKHADGHTETNTITLPYDPSGSKNGVQSVGSARSYGKRYTTEDILNLRAEGQDDDGNLGAHEPISNEQLTQLLEMCERLGVKKDMLAKYIGVAELADLPASQFADTVATIKRVKGAA